MARTHNAIRPMDNTKGPRRVQSRWIWYLLAVIIVVIALAWIDGGEEPLHPIVQEIEVPERL